MKRILANCLASVLATSHAWAASVPAEAAEPERVGGLGIVVFILVFVVLTVAMVAVPFLRKRGKGGDGDTRR